MSKLLFTADWHIGEIAKPNTHSFLRPRPTDVMVDRWIDHCQEMIRPDDTLVFLGDAVITLEDLKVLGRLPRCQHKIFIMGDKEERFDWDELNACLEVVGFTHAWKTQEVEIDGQEYFMAHKPTDCLKESNGLPALCGHVHGIWRTQRMPNGQPIINVGIDAWGGLVTGEFVTHQYNCVTKGYYDVNCFPQDWEKEIATA